jgi:hypothetical protein
VTALVFNTVHFMRSCARFTPSPQQWTISARRQHIVNL